MTDNLKVAGLRLVIEGAAEFNSTISKVNSQLKLSAAEFSKLQAQYGKGANNIELLAGKQKLLQDKLQGTKDIQQQYNRILEETVKKYGENSVEADKVRTAIAKNEAEEIKLEKQLASVTRELQVQSSAWTQFGQKCETAGQKLQTIGDKVSGIGKTLSTRVTAPIAAAGTVAVKAAADLEDAMGATEQIFGNAADSVKDWVDDLDTYYGIAEKDALTYVNTMGSMLQNIGGLSAEAAADTGGRLLELAGDLTAMYGGTVDDAVRALTGALKGNNTMLDNYGMAVNDALIKSKALEMGLIDEGEQLTLAAKQGATLALIYEQTAAAQGQAAREAEGASGSFRTLKTEAKNLAADLGSLLLPAASKIIKVITQLVQKLSALSPETKELVLNIAAVAAGVGPVLLIVGKLVSSLGSVLTVVGKAAKAFGVLSSATGAFSGLIGALGGPVGVAAVALVGLALALSDGESAYGKLVKTLNKAEKSWKKVNEAKSEALENGAEEIADIQTLKLELDSIVDANGRVKKGYEERARFIAGELSKATGTEINLVDGVIQSYDELSATIDNYISMRRAEIAIEAGEDAYKAAIQGRKDLEQAYVDSYNAMLKAQEDYNIAAAGREQAEAGQRLARATELYEGLKTQYEGYGEEIKTYEADLTAFRNGEYDQVAAGLSGLLVSMEQFTAMSKEEQDQQVADTSAALEEKKQLYQLTGDETTKIQADALAQQLKDEETYLADRDARQRTADADFTAHQSRTHSELEQASSQHYTREESNETSHLNRMVSNISQQSGPALSATKQVTGAVSGELSSVENKTYNWGWNAISGFIEGIRDRKRGVADACAEIAATVQDYIGHNSPAKKGPGRFIVKWGENAIKGWIKGMMSMQPKLEEAAAAMAGAAMGEFNTSPTTDNRSYSYGGVTVNVQSMNVRSESDIKQVAQELYRLQVRNARGRGVVA